MKNYENVCLVRNLNWLFWATYLTASHELHHEEEVLLVLVDVVELDNVRVVDLLQNFDLVLEADFVFTCQLPPMN